LIVILAGMALAALTGCGFSGSATAFESPVALHGTVNGGQQPVSGSRIQLYAAGTTGPGSAAQALLGNPVQSDKNGNFSIPASYRCPSANAQIYVVASGGNSELASNAGNPALELTAMLGSCSGISASNAIIVNEVTTIGSVWPLAAFMTSSSGLGSTPNDTSFLDAVSSVPEFINIAQGSSPGKPTTTSYFAENSKLYSLSNLLANCVNSTGGSAGDGSPCGLLFSIATPPGGSAPADTMTAALRIAQNPSNNVTEIFGLAKTNTYFQPALTATPGDWTLPLTYMVAVPAISPATGSYVGAQQVTISDSTPGSKIYYTTNGTVPTSSSTPYTGPLSIATSSTVQAIAVLLGSPSAVASSTLTITSSPSSPIPAPPIPAPPIPAPPTPAPPTPTTPTPAPPTPTKPTPTKPTPTKPTPTTPTPTTPTPTTPAPTTPAPATPAKLVFTQQPSNASTQAAISPAVLVSVEDSSGKLVTTATNPVTLALTGGQSLVGTLTEIPANGVVTFNNLTINTAGSSYTLTATSAGLTPAISTTFMVSAPASAPVPGSVSVTVQPGSITLGTAQPQAFSATVSGTSNTGVTWSLSPSLGSISSAGFYTAPSSISSGQTVTVTATSEADPSKTASALVTLAPPSGVSYYVSNSGSNANNGTSASSPWKTIAHVNTQSFKPGDSILFQAGGTWREQLNIIWKGSAGSPIIFGSYGSGTTPIISGGDLFASWTSETTTGSNPSGEIYFAPYTTVPLQVFRNGSRLTQASAKASLTTGQWWLDSTNHRIYVFDNPAGQTVEADQRPYAIYSACSQNIYVTVVGLQLQEAQVHGMYTCGFGVWTVSQIVALNNYIAGLRLDGPGAGTSVTNSIAAYNGASGFEFYAAPNVLVAYDIAHNNVALPGNLYSAGIKLDPSAATTNAIVEYSTSYTNGVGEVGVTGSGIWADTIGNGLILRYNTVYNNNERGLDIDADNDASAYGNVSYGNVFAGIMAYADTSNSMTGNQIRNNTVWGNGMGIVVQGPNTGSVVAGCENNAVTNNIVGASLSGPNMWVQLGCENPGSDGAGNTYTYNSFGKAATNFIEWGANNYDSTYAGWETAAGDCGTAGCSHSIENDPLLTNPAQGVFTLQSTSPAIGAGDGGVDLGAIPYVAQ
jgi:Chitobiase/beta-hexosaminidase C-terminal domain